MLTAWRQLREQIAVFDKAVRTLAKNDPTCRLLMSVPGIGVVTVLAYVEHGRGPSPLCPIAVGWCAHRADAKAISVGRSRSQRADFAMRRHAGPHPDVRGGCRDVVAGQKGFGSEGLGPSDCQAIGDWQGACRVGEEALHNPAQHLAVGRTVPLVSGASGRLSLSCKDTFARLRSRVMSCPPGRGCRQTARVAVGRHYVRVSPLWTLQCLCFGPDVAADALPTAERTVTSV